MPARGTAPFCFERSDFDESSGEVSLVYRFEGQPVFDERIRFPLPPGGVDQHDPTLAAALRILHLVAGTSYYKTRAPLELVFGDAVLAAAGELAEAEVDLVSQLYDHGLREFAFRNGLPVPLTHTLLTVAGPLVSAGNAHATAASPEPHPSESLKAGRGLGSGERLEPAEGLGSGESLEPAEGLGSGGGLKAGGSVEPAEGLGSGGGLKAGGGREPAEGLERTLGIGEPLVPFGGGKDSAVVLSLLPEATALTVNPVPAQRRLAEALGHDLVVVARRVDRIDDLIGQDSFNGHVPVTAIVSAISLVFAVIWGKTHVVMANERAASEPTTWTADGLAINHQYSKGAHFEKLFRQALASRSIPVCFFSLLRDQSEAEIAARLARRPELLGLLSSCNQTFRGHTTGATPSGTSQTGAVPTGAVPTGTFPAGTVPTSTVQADAAIAVVSSSRADAALWCGRCPKCCATYLMLAACAAPEQLNKAFGSDLLDDPARIENFRALWDPQAKPFECVGERHEAARAMAALRLDPRWCQHIVVVATAAEAERRLRLSPVAAGAAADLEAPASAIPQPYRVRLDQAGSVLP